MSQEFSTISIERLCQWVLKEEAQGQIFGIHNTLFFAPKPGDRFTFPRYGEVLETPIGVAAGPHTQMAQNIISAWLCGARYIELKTVQTLDEIKVSKPCIDMQDEGYNCEWSQELRLDDSFDEYLNAWIMIHLLRHKFGWKKDRGFIFNMSVGYNMDGILKPNVQRFLAKMADSGDALKRKITAIRPVYPKIDEIEIPSKLSDSITLSTMHGCPPEEIEKIGRYLISERGYQTTIKLNPTLLGPDQLRHILNDRLGFETTVPDEAFGHDLKYTDALSLIRNLSQAAMKGNTQFSLKLTNTLEAVNHKDVFPPNERMMYMSGRALHPISIALAAKLQNEFDGKLDLSFSGGADCFNFPKIIACGIRPVSVCSDILKPGGYARIGQYLANLEQVMTKEDASDIGAFIRNFAGVAGRTSTCPSPSPSLSLSPSTSTCASPRPLPPAPSPGKSEGEGGGEKTGSGGGMHAGMHAAEEEVRKAALVNLRRYAGTAAELEACRKDSKTGDSVKTNRALPAFDCIKAPCTSTCPAGQDIPAYLYFTAQGDFARAYDVILRTNPFPNVLGMVCDHHCQHRCTRSNYDSSLLIREVKRFIADKGGNGRRPQPAAPNGKKAAIIGAGPSGLACAYFLALDGFKVTVFETKAFAGGMVSDAIPSFRLTEEAIRRDVENIRALGVEIRYDQKIDRQRFAGLRKENDFVYIAIGAQEAKKMEVPGEDARGVYDCLKFLSDVRRNRATAIGPRVAVVGGGNSAMDAARTAQRLVGESGKVIVVYRRTHREMPADQEEILATIEDGVEFLELQAPVEVVIRDGKASALKCQKMKLGQKGPDGRAKPEKISGAIEEIPFDTIIPAIGQNLSPDFIEAADLKADPGTGMTRIENVFAGGDAVRGGASIVKAVADGKLAATSIISKSGGSLDSSPARFKKGLSLEQFQQRASQRFPGLKISSLQMPNPQVLSSRMTSSQVLGSRMASSQVLGSRMTSPRIPDGEIGQMKGFTPIIRELTEVEAVEEAKRCLYCNDICNVCVTVCPNRANRSYKVNQIDIPIVKAVRDGEGYRLETERTMRLSQDVQTLNIGDFCNECGNCATFCPSSGAPYRDKPKFYLTPESFNREKTGYHLTPASLLARDDGTDERLEARNGVFWYEGRGVRARLNPLTLVVETVMKSDNPPTEILLERAVLLGILFQSLRGACFS